MFLNVTKVSKCFQLFYIKQLLQMIPIVLDAIELFTMTKKLVYIILSLRLNLLRRTSGRNTSMILSINSNIFTL